MRRAFWLPAIALAFLAGCVTSSDMQRLEDQIVDLHDEVTDLKRRSSSKEEVEVLNRTLASRTESILRSNADLAVKVNEIDDKMQNTQGTIEQANYRIDRLVQQIAQNQREIAELKRALRIMQPESDADAIQDEVMVTAPGSPQTTDPLALYQSAYRDYQRGNFPLAIEGFRQFVEENPSSDLADNAAYWIGESLYSQQQYRPAIVQFDEVINQYPRSDKVPAALLKKGYAYIELGEKAQGIVQLQYVLHEHPTSQEASLAREKLRSLGIETR